MLQRLIQYLKEYDLLPEHEPMQESVQFFGDGFVRTEASVLSTMVKCSMAAAEEEENHNYTLLDTPKINLLIMSLPQKYVFTKVK